MYKFIRKHAVKRSTVCHLYPGISMIFLEIFLKLYHYTGKPSIKISWFNNIILMSLWHISLNQDSTVYTCTVTWYFLHYECLQAQF